MEEETLLTALREKNENAGPLLVTLLDDDSKLMDIFQAALEEINFHRLNRYIDAWREKEGI